MADLKLALHMNDNSLIDSSTYAHTITIGGGAQVDYFNYKFLPGSAYFDGNNDYLTIDNTAGNLDFGAGDFSIHCWVNFATSSTATRRIVDFRQAGTTEVQIAFQTDAASKLTYYVNGAVRCQGTTVFAAGTWYHVAIIRNTGTTKMYVNGVQEGADYADGNNFASATTVYVGNRYDSTGDYKGYIDELLMYNIAENPATYPPTEQLDTGHTTEAQTAGIKLQTEIVIPDTRVAGISLQVEITPPVGPEPHVIVIEVFELEQIAGNPSHTLEVGSDTDTVCVTGHGLVAGDMILNTNRIGWDTTPPSGTYTNGYGATEPGCRRVDSVSNIDSVEIAPALLGQTDGDVAYFYKWVDRTEYVREGTLQIDIKSKGQSTAAFEIRCSTAPGALDYYIIPGQLVRISIDGVIRVMGVATGINFKSDIIVNAIFQPIQLIPMNTIAARRTINITRYAGDTYGDIVDDMVDDYLVYEGITKGTIDAGATLIEDWIEDKINIATILDECEKKSGYQWFIGPDKKLNFYQDPASISLAPYDIDDSAVNSFDIENIEVNVSMDNYTNKVFVVGGNDAYGNQIWTAQSDLLEIARMKTYCGGTGTWGSVYNDSSLVSYDYKTAEAGTDSNTLNITGHGLSIGDCYYNITCNQYAYVWAISSVDSVEIEPPISAQNVGDDIELFPANYLVSQNIMKLQCIEPAIVEFDTFQVDFDVQQKMGIKLTRFEMDTVGYYNIESIQMQEISKHNSNGWLIKSHITAVKRNSANFSTQRLRDYFAYYNSIVSRKPGYNGSRGSVNPRRTISDTAPLYPKHGDEWLDIGAIPAVNYWWDSTGPGWTA